jgi:hypothetical protein
MDSHGHVLLSTERRTAMRARLTLPVASLLLVSACATASPSTREAPGAPRQVEVVNTTRVDLELHTSQQGMTRYFDVIRSGEVRRFTLPPGVERVICRLSNDQRPAEGCRVRYLDAGS